MYFDLDQMTSLCWNWANDRQSATWAESLNGVDWSINTSEVPWPRPKWHHLAGTESLIGSQLLGSSGETESGGRSTPLRYLYLDSNDITFVELSQWYAVNYLDRELRRSRLINISEVPWSRPKWHHFVGTESLIGGQLLEPRAEMESADR